VESNEKAQADNKNSTDEEIKVAVTTRSQSSTSAFVDNNREDDREKYTVANETANVQPCIDVDDMTSLRKEIGRGDKNAVMEEQQNDESLASAWRLARKNKGNYLIKDGLLYRKESICGQQLINLVVPKSRRASVLKLAHDSCHFGGQRTYERIILSGLTWGPSDTEKSVRADAIEYAAKCPTCQMHARVTCFDRVPIHAVVSDPVVFRHMQMDVFGPIIPTGKIKYNYALLVICSATRYPWAFPLHAPTAKNVCEALIKMFEVTGIANEMVLTSDNASYNRSALMREFLKRLGVTPRFSTPYHPEGHSLAERAIQTLQNVIVKLADEHKNNWTAYLGPALWAMREAKNTTTGLPPHVMVFGHSPRGPLAILRDTWTGECDFPQELKTDAVKYLSELRDKLQAANEYANQHRQIEQNRYVRTYNKRARDKHFAIGEKCLILQKDDTSNAMFSKWKGPAVIVDVKSPYSYIVQYNGIQYHLHANRLRKFLVRADDVECNCTMYVTPDSLDEAIGIHSCAIIYEKDAEFGKISVVDSGKFQQYSLLPSKKIAPQQIAHLSQQQQKQLLDKIDQYPEVFSETPGLCTVVEHEIPILENFKPKRLRAYRVPENFREEVARQIGELLRLGFIEPSVSAQVSPLVCVLKPKGNDGKQAIRICVDYRYVNRFTKPSQSFLEDIPTIIQKIGRSKFISKFDVKAGYHHCPVKLEDRWLTAFVFDNQVYQWCRTPFGMKGSGNTFV
jgi:transposase InsO family protein